MKKIIGLIILSIGIAALTGCGRGRYPDLPKDAFAFEMGSFEDTEHDSVLFGTLEYNGRTYIGYGTINNHYKRDVVDQCIGYIIRDENSSSTTDLNDKNRRVYTLAGDDDHNFLMDYDDTVKLMNQPDFWRAMDTKGEEIVIPDYIDDLGYEYWK